MNFIRRIPNYCSNLIVPSSTPLYVMGSSLSVPDGSITHHLGKHVDVKTEDIHCRFYQGFKAVVVGERKFIIPNILVDRIKNSGDPYELMRNQFNIYCYDTITKEEANSIREKL